MSQLEADPYGSNPLVEDLKGRNPGVFQMASSEGPAPTLFASGDLPPFTASGIDPQVLMRLPFTMRHHAAADPDAASVLGLIEQYADLPDYSMDHQGLEEYRTRVYRWASGMDKPAAVMSQAEEDELMSGLFGDPT